MLCKCVIYIHVFFDLEKQYPHIMQLQACKALNPGQWFSKDRTDLMLLLPSCTVNVPMFMHHFGFFIIEYVRDVWVGDWNENEHDLMITFSFFLKKMSFSSHIIKLPTNTSTRGLVSNSHYPNSLNMNRTLNMNRISLEYEKGRIWGVIKTGDVYNVVYTYNMYGSFMAAPSGFCILHLII